MTIAECRLWLDEPSTCAASTRQPGVVGPFGQNPSDSFRRLWLRPVAGPAAREAPLGRSVLLGRSEARRLRRGRWTACR